MQTCSDFAKTRCCCCCAALLFGLPVSQADPNFRPQPSATACVPKGTKGHPQQVLACRHCSVEWVETWYGDRLGMQHGHQQGMQHSMRTAHAPWAPGMQHSMGTGHAAWWLCGAEGTLHGVWSQGIAVGGTDRGPRGWLHTARAPGTHRARYRIKSTANGPVSETLKIVSL